jgi:hypothetical protein
MLNMKTWRLVLDRALETLHDLPHMMRVGLGITALGAVIDITYHVSSKAPMGHGAIAFIGHLVTLVGMVVTMAGVIAAAYMHRSSRTRGTGKGVAR